MAAMFFSIDHQQNGIKL